MALADIEGQPRALEQLRAALSSGRIHHAYLFAGPPGAGKSRAARRFAQGANCERGVDGCGACDACRRIDHGSHPDVLSIGPTLADGTAARDGEIRVGQVRDLCAALQLAPLLARRKFAIVAAAERMNPQAQNALLKTLEEPPPDTTLVLVGDDAEKLLPTVRSRCLRVSFGPLPAEVIERRLVAEGLVPEDAKLRARLCRGDAGMARRLDEAALHRREELCAQLARIVAARGTGMSACAEALDLAERHATDRSRALAVLAETAWWLRDVIVVGAGADGTTAREDGGPLEPGETTTRGRGGSPTSCLPAFVRDPIVNLDRLDDLRGAAARLSPAAALAAVAALGAAARAIEGNGAPRLQLEAAFLVLAGAA